jgi:ribosome-binding factor A
MADPARARKVADRIKVIVAEYLEHRVKDERLGFVTITDVRVTGDLQHASIFYTVFGDDAARQATAEVLEVYRGRIRSAVGKQIQIRLTPSLEFIADALPADSAHLEDVLAKTRARDAELARAAAGATYAGDADPYKKSVDEAADDGDADNDSPGRATAVTSSGGADQDAQAR